MPGIGKPTEQCDYLVDLDSPKRPRSSERQPWCAAEETVRERVPCMPVWDSQSSQPNEYSVDGPAIYSVQLPPYYHRYNDPTIALLIIM